MFKISYFLEVLPVIARRVNVTFELTMISTLFALLVGVVVAIIAYYRVPVLYQASRVYVSIMRGTPIVAQLYFFYFGIALYSTIVRDMKPLMATRQRMLAENASEPTVNSVFVGRYMTPAQQRIAATEKTAIIFAGSNHFIANVATQRQTMKSVIAIV